jgi:hemerythrin
MIEWKEVYSIGNNTIDEDHKKLFKILNSLEESINSLKAENISDLLNILIQYSEEHFKNEEQEMIKHSYFRIDKHIKEHNEFIESVKQIEKKSMNLTFGTMMNMTNFLKDWIITHLLGTDKEFEEFMRSKNDRS